MKNRPLKHKASNKFTFKSFRDRIKDIDVRRGALYRVETDHELADGDEGTYFQQALKKWSVLNLTTEYIAFQRGFKDSFTLPLLLFNRDAIFKHLIECLQKATDVALEPLLELLVALAKDLRKDFQGYFFIAFEVLEQFLHSTSADRVEWTLLCLAHLFKILRSFLRSDFNLTFNRLVPLLDETKSPPHAVDFATECLGYLARELKNKRTLVDLLLKWQMQSDAFTVACGRLVFEVLHGVQEHFHASAKQTMQELFEVMGQLDEAEADHLQEILTQTFTDVVECIQPEDISVFWETMKVTIDGCIARLEDQSKPGEQSSSKKSESMETTTNTDAETSPETRIVNHLTRLLQLSGIVLEHNHGRLLGNALSGVVSQLIKLLTTLSSPTEEFNETVVNQIIVLLRSKHIRLTQLEASRLTMNVLMLDHRPLYERFVAATVNCSMFEALIWPNFVKMFEAELDDARVCFMAGLLLQKVPLCGNGLQLESWKPFPVHVVANGNVECYMNKLLAVNQVELEYVIAQYELYVSALIILPHLANFKGASKAVTALKDSIEYAVKFLQTEIFVSSAIKGKIVQLIAVTVETLIHMQEIGGKDCFLLLEKLLPIVTLQDCLLLNSAHMLVSYVAQESKSLLTFARFAKIRPFVHPLLFSYSMPVRQLASGILTKFDHLSELAVAMGPLYRTIAQIESIEPLIHTYREQVILYQQLAFDSQQYQQAAKVARDEWTETVLQYMLSIFAINFKLLWEPATTIVLSYAENMTKGDEELFWRIFDSRLTLAENKLPHEEVASPLATTDEEDSADPEEESESGDDSELMAKVMACFLKNPNIDYHNVRVHLLRTLQRCTHFCRSKGDRIVDRFFAFLESTDESKSKCDAGEDAPGADAAAVDSEIRRKSSKTAGNDTQQLLFCYLNICTELNRKSMRKHANRLYATYETLASSRNEDIQKAALTGIFSFGDAQLVPYKDFLFRLTSEKTIKHSLLSVLVPSEDEPDGEDAESGNTGRTRIAEEHRPKVVQLMLKVLDGKIIQNLGSSGSGGPFKATILTFIGRLREEELEMLLNRWFEPYLRQLKDTPIASVHALSDANVQEEQQAIQVPPPYRMNMLLKLLSSLLTEVAPLQPVAFASRVLHLKIYFDALLMGLDHSIYKKYKSQALLSLVEVFKQYEQSYQWSPSELDAIMHVHVWPQLENLPSDSIHTPTPLLKLLLAWSRSEQLYVLLERKQADLSMSSLDAMIALLKGPQTSGSVCTEIFTALATMLESDRQKGEQEAPPADAPRDQPLSQRSRLLVPYVKELLEYIRQSLKSKKSISSSLLLILTRIAESGMISSSSEGKNKEAIEDDRNSLLKLLFPILNKKVATVNEIVSDHLEASQDIRRLHVIILRLLKEVRTPQQYLKQLGQLLEMVKDVVCRKTILQMFDILTPLSAELQLIGQLVHQLNAMDKRWIDQPDHATRTAGYRSVDELLLLPDGQRSRMTGSVAMVFLSQAFHVLQFERELSPRQNATEYACKVLVFLATAHDASQADVQYCVDRIVLRGITAGLHVKRTGSDRRTESVQLLGELSRQVGGLAGGKVRPEFRVFRELWQFTGPGMGDLERDFFDNVTHLQTQYHRKALKRLAIQLAGMAKKGSKGSKDGVVLLSPRTVVQFLIPIVSHYICHDAYKRQTNLVEEAGSCIINLCHFLTWRSYQTLLQQYLKKLRYAWEYQKQVLRIVIGIMDAFHFDLSMATGDGAVEQPASGSTPAGNALMDKKLKLPSKEEEEQEETQEEEQEEKKEETVDEAKTEKEGEEADEAEDEDEVAALEAALEEEEKEEEQQRRKALDAHRVARAIVDDISRTIIPGLLSSFNYASEAPRTGPAGMQSQADKKARFAKQKEEMQKLPLAIAIVKLFMKLPRREIELNLPKLIIKVITFLKSRLKLVRAQARNTLAHITLELGPSYLSFVLQNLLAMLTRGFQRHVLTFTVHTIIERAQKHLSSGQVLEHILQTVLQICMEDVFGQLIGLMNGTTIEGGSLRKDSTPESKSNRKPYQTLYLLARHATVPMLIDLFAPFRGVLLKFRTHQTVTKVQDAFRRLTEGIVANESVDPEALLAFVYGMLSGKVYVQCAVASGEDPPPADDGQRGANGRKLLGKVSKPGSIYLIPAEPKRYGAAAAAANLEYTLATTEGNDHVFVESGLNMLLQFVKQRHGGTRLTPADRTLFGERIDPMVPLLVQSLDSKHSRIICLAVDCLGLLWSTRWPLASFERQETVERMMRAIFAILHRYNTVALDVNNPNFAMVKASFRAIVSILKYGQQQSSYSFSPEQQALLVMYIDQDLAVGGGRQTMAFVLLRALIARRYTSAELRQLMQKVFETAVRSEGEGERAECRQIIVEYIMNYKHGRKALEKHLLFFVEQLQYEVAYGRESTAYLLKTLFQKLPKETIDEYIGALFFGVGVRLMNEEDTNLRTLVADCIETLLRRFDGKQKSLELVPIIIDMLQDGQLKHRELATQLLLRIIRSEPTAVFIGSWLDKVLPTLLQNLVPQLSNEPGGVGMYVKPIALVKTLVNVDARGDHLIIQTLHVFEELLQLYPALLDDGKYNDTIDSLAYTAQTLLGSGHQWVRLGALKVLYKIMNELDFETVHRRIKTITENPSHEDEGEESQQDDDVGREFFYRAPLRDSKALTLDLCAQLTPGSGMVNEGDDEAAGLVTQILFVVANVLRAVPLAKETDTASSKKVNLYWLVRRVRYVIQSEVLKTPHMYTLRKHALHWMSSVVAILEQDMLEQLAPALLIPAVRELTASQEASNGKSKTVENDPWKASLRKVATKLCKDISQRLGTTTYDKIRNTLEESLRRKRIDRKVQLAQEKINQPFIAARRKESKKLRGKEAKKRKMQSHLDRSEANGGAKDGGVMLGVKRRVKSGKGGGAPKKRTKMEAMFRE